MGGLRPRTLLSSSQLTSLQQPLHVVQVSAGKHPRGSGAASSHEWVGGSQIYLACTLLSLLFLATVTARRCCSPFHLPGYPKRNTGKQALTPEPGSLGNGVVTAFAQRVCSPELVPRRSSQKPAGSPAAAGAWVRDARLVEGQLGQPETMLDRRQRG